LIYFAHTFTDWNLRKLQH